MTSNLVATKTELLVLVLLAALLSPAPGLGQTPGGVLSRTAERVLSRTPEERTEWFPESFAYEPLIAKPLQVDLGGALIFANRDGDNDFQGTNLEAIAAIGHRLPVVRFGKSTPTAPDIVLGFEVGVFSRFALEENQRDLINSDFRVGAPLTIRTREWDFGIELLHVSSHIGDDFLARFPRPNEQVARNGIDFLAARRLGRTVRLYVGGDVNLWSSTVVEGNVFRWGGEWDEGLRGEGSIWPFAAMNFEITDKTERVSGTGAIGSAFRLSRILFRLNGEGHFGPSPMGQFRTVDENYVGLNLTGYFLK